MTNSSPIEEKLKKRLNRERTARKSAEAIIEHKSRELYLANCSLQEAHQDLQEKTAELSQLNQQLTQEVRKRVQLQEELKIALNDALELSKLKSDFLANVSHELRTPLNGIIGLTDILCDSVSGGEQREYLDQISTCSDNLLTVVEDILDFSNLASENVTVDSGPFSVHDLLNELKAGFAKTTLAKGLTLHIDVNPNVPPIVEGDKKILKRILYKLIDNGVRFTESGEVRVSAAVQKQIDSHIGLQFAIEDTGIGIPEDKLEHIFKSFSQVDSSLTRKAEGMGLGLSICKELTEALGGSIHVKSKLGAGSIFTLNLHLTVPKHKKEAEKPAGNQPLNVLYVDDSRANQKLASILFKRIGCQLELANDTSTALEVLASKQMDAVLVDVYNPSFDGVSLIKQIKQIYGEDRPQIIALLSNQDMSEEAMHISLGVDACINAPLKFDTISSLLQGNP